MNGGICIIDDDEIYQKIIKKLILRAGLWKKAFFYRSAEEALAAFKDPGTELPDVILLDVNMPVMDGWQFIELLQKAFPFLFTECEIYMVTSSIAYSDKEKMNDFPQLAGFLSKPLSVEQLVEIGRRIK